MSRALATVDVDGLNDLLAPLNRRQRVYILYRICDFDRPAALALSGSSQNLYNSWCKDTEVFVPVHQKLKALRGCKEQAMKLLRRRNQQNAVVLEGKIIEILVREVSGDKKPNLLKTRLGQMVFDKLLTPLDVQPQVHLSWTDRAQEYLVGGVHADSVSKTGHSQPKKYQEGDLLQRGTEALDEAEEADQEGDGTVEGEWAEIDGQDSADEQPSEDSR